MSRNGTSHNDEKTKPAKSFLTVPTSKRAEIKAAETDYAKKVRRAKTAIAQANLAEAELGELVAVVLGEINAPQGWGVDTDTWEVKPMPQQQAQQPAPRSS